MNQGPWPHGHQQGVCESTADGAITNDLVGTKISCAHESNGGGAIGHGLMDTKRVPLGMWAHALRGPLGRAGSLAVAEEPAQAGATGPGRGDGDGDGDEMIRGDAASHSIPTNSGSPTPWRPPVIFVLPVWRMTL